VSDVGSRALDLADQYAQEQRDAAVRSVTSTLSVEGLDSCIDCSRPIDEARRKAIPSARRCVSCQEDREKSAR